MAKKKNNAPAVETTESIDQQPGKIYFGIHREYLEKNRREKTNARPAVTLITTPDKIDQTIHGIIFKIGGQEIGRLLTDTINYFPVEGGLVAWVQFEPDVEIEIINEPRS